MVQAIININEHANTILNIIKAKFGLRDKSEAINIMAKQYEEEVLESKLRPEYVKKIKRATKVSGIRFKSVAELTGILKGLKSSKKLMVESRKNVSRFDYSKPRKSFGKRRRK